MRRYQDTATGIIWAFDDVILREQITLDDEDNEVITQVDVAPLELPSSPATLSSTIIERPAQGNYTWEDGEWVADLAATKAAKWENLKVSRSAAEYGGFTAGALGTYDSDLASQSKIIGACLAAQMAIAGSQPFEISWTRADNSSIELDAEDMLVVGVAMQMHLNDVYEHGREKRDAINNAATVEDVIEIVW